MEAGPKSKPDPEASGDITGKFMGLMTEHDDSAVDISPEIPIREELIVEVMQELYREITNNSNISDNSGPGPGPRPKTFIPTGSVIVPTTSFDVMVGNNGKSESCGACISESASTVMAGIEFVGSTRRFSGGNVGSTRGKTTIWKESSGSSGYWWDHHDDDQVEKASGVMDGCDGCDGHQDLDDEWLARVLSCGPVELDPWF